MAQSPSERRRQALQQMMDIAAARMGVKGARPVTMGGRPLPGGPDQGRPQVPPTVRPPRMTGRVSPPGSESLRKERGKVYPRPPRPTPGRPVMVGPPGKKPPYTGPHRPPSRGPIEGHGPRHFEGLPDDVRVIRVPDRTEGGTPSTVNGRGQATGGDPLTPRQRRQRAIRLALGIRLGHATPEQLALLRRKGGLGPGRRARRHRGGAVAGGGG